VLIFAHNAHCNAASGLAWYELLAAGSQLDDMFGPALCVIGSAWALRCPRHRVAGSRHLEHASWRCPARAFHPNPQGSWPAGRGNRRTPDALGQREEILVIPRSAPGALPIRLSGRPRSALNPWRSTEQARIKKD